MAREKKIRIRATLNRDVMGRYTLVTKGPTYPLYLDINYDRQFTKFPYGAKWYSVKEYQELTGNFILEGNIRAVERIVRHEANRNPDFKLKGFAKKVKSYLSSFHEAGYLAAAHFSQQLLRKKLPHDDFINLLDSSPIAQIKLGFKNLKDDDLATLESMVRSAQLVALIWSDGLILTWLVNHTDDEKVEYAKEGFEIGNDYNDYDLANYVDKKMPPHKAVDDLDKIAHYVIDNELFVDMKYITESEDIEWISKEREN